MSQDISFLKCLTFLLLATQYASSLTVTNLEDSGEGSLRYALATVAPDDIITFAPSLQGGVIVLTSGTLIIDRKITIVGQGQDKGPRISATGQTFSTMTVVDQGDLEMTGVVLDTGYRGIEVQPGGQAKMTDCRVANHDYGGGFSIQSGSPSGSLILERCLFEKNRQKRGGAGYNFGHLEARGCTFRENRAREEGGAIYHRGSWILDGCLFVGNVAEEDEGGALWLRRDCIITNCTFTENIADNEGGAIYTSKDLYIYHCTITGNTGTQGSGLYCEDPPEIQNCIIAGNTVTGTWDTAANYNGSRFEDESSNNFLQEDGDPPLQPLGDYGGPTWTMPPVVADNSPLIDQGVAITRENVSMLMAGDGRGLERVVEQVPDIGAVEYQGAEGELMAILTSSTKDIDEDGMPNLLEAILGRDPRVPDANSPRNLQIIQDPFGCVLRFGFDPDFASAVKLRLMMSEDMEHFHELLSDQMINETRIQNRYLDYDLTHQGYEGLFFKLEAEPR